MDPVAADDMERFRRGVAAWAKDAAAPVPGAVGELAGSVAMAVLVEGESDRAAIEALAASRGRDLAGERVAVIPLGGAMNIRTYLNLLGPPGLGLDLAGLCDVNEEGYFRRGLEHTGFAEKLDADGMEVLGFFVCTADLEDEFIRFLGTDAVERAMESQGDLRAFRTFQNQPAQRGRAVEAQQRRFLGSIGGRKSRYARALVAELGRGRAPRPLGRLLEYTARSP